MYYMCASPHFENGEYFRVAFEDFEVLSEHYPNDFECMTQVV